MRVSLGKFVRRYVYGVRMGERRVAAIYHGGKLIWPTLSDTVYSAVLDVAGIEDTLAGAQFRHALEAVRKKGVSEACYILMNAGGREYMLSAGFGRYDVAAWDGHATVVFGDNGPLSEALQAGDEVTLNLVVPTRTTALYEGEARCSLPFLPDTCLNVWWSKGQKKVAAGRWFTVKGFPSGVVHFGGLCDTSEHKRNTYVRVLPGNTHKWFNAVYNGAFVPGDTGLEVSTGLSGSGLGGGVSFTFPKFTATIKMRVSAVTMHA